MWLYGYEAGHKKSLFPVQWVAKIMVSRAAAFFFSPFFFPGVGKYSPILDFFFFLQK